MTAFFVKTDDSAAGPFTGVELREAALAGIVSADSLIGAGPQGPWTLANDAGLFSASKLPLPHPAGTHVPQYQVRGMQGGLTGPFKLRELIGFAAHGMLPPDAMLKSDVSAEWISLQRIPVLVGCLSGALVLLGTSGKVHLRTRGGQRGETHDNDGNAEEVRAPIELSKSIDVTQSNLQVATIDDRESSQPLVVGDEGLVTDDEAGDESVDANVNGVPEASKPRRRLSLPKLQISLPANIPRRLIINTVCVLLVVAGLGAAYSYWRTMGMSAASMLGDWIVEGDEGPSFGVSFREDGTIVIFNATGNSFTGDYVWARSSGTDGFQSNTPFSFEVDQLSEGHELGTVLPTDGYIRLRGYVDVPPNFGGHTLEDCFLRSDGDELGIGYLTRVTWTQQEKQLEAGWMHGKKSTASSANIIDALSQIEKERRPTSGYAVDKSPHIAKAIIKLRDSAEADALDGDVNSGSFCYSRKVNAAYLLQNFGMPDEARPVQPFEVPVVASGAPSFDGAQLVRYGMLTLILRSDGTVQHVAIMF